MKIRISAFLLLIILLFSTAFSNLEEEKPEIKRISLKSAGLVLGESWELGLEASVRGKLVISIKNGTAYEPALEAEVEAGESLIKWDGRLSGELIKPGVYMLKLELIAREKKSAPQYISLKAAEKQPEAKAEGDEKAPDKDEEANDEENDKGEENTGDKGKNKSEEDKDSKNNKNGLIASKEDKKYFIPSTEQPKDGDNSFWTLPIGRLNEKAIWEALMKPITIVQGKDQRQTYKLRKKPDKSMSRDNIVGEVTFQSQGVHVLETLKNGWSLIETYNSSYGPTFKRKGYGNTDDYIKGYVETNLLKEIKPNEQYGILIDKLTQKLYVFEKGKLKGELTISTGLPNAKAPWNETPSGEYLVVSRVGDFLSGNLVCQMALRINGGMLIHEVPYINYPERNLKDYSAQVNQLGYKASHGCVRVQKAKNAQGMNHEWLWKNIKLNTKVLIWDDDNRYIEQPSDDLDLYYNPKGGKYYHINKNCLSVKAKLLPLKGTFKYSELEDEFSHLEACPHCKAPLSRDKIQEKNRENGFENE